MKKILTTILILSSLVFAKEYRSYTYAHVTKSKPIYEYRYNRVYNNECEDDYYESSYEPNYYNDNSNNIGLDTLIGATIGVAIGNQIGKGNGRDVAKVAGGILGASYANHNRHNNYNSHPKKYKKRHYKQCDDGYYTTAKKRVLVGYKNYFYYKNERHFKVTNRPKNRIKITKIVSY